MLNRSASLAMSTCVLKALPGKLDIKRHSPSILYILVCEVWDKHKAGYFNATNLTTYDFSTLYTTLLYNLIKEKFIYLTERTLKMKALISLNVRQKCVFTWKQPNKYHAWSCQNVCDALTFLLDTLYAFALSCVDKLQGFLWTLIVLPLLWICSCFVMRGTLWYHFLMISRLRLLTFLIYIFEWYFKNK